MQVFIITCFNVIYEYATFSSVDMFSNFQGMCNYIINDTLVINIIPLLSVTCDMALPHEQ